VSLVIAAAGSAHAGVFGAVMLVGFVVGVFGHIIKSRPVIVTGILLVGLASVTFVLQPNPAA
jgi:hypothetical protein